MSKIKALPPLFLSKLFPRYWLDFSFVTGDISIQEIQQILFCKFYLAINVSWFWMLQGETSQPCCRKTFLKVSQFQNVLLVSSNLPKNQQKIFQDFCPSLQKSSVRGSKENPPISGIKCSYFFLIWPLFQGRNPRKILLVFLKIWRHQKDISKSTDL